nr:PREDICTED: ras-related protein RHN1 isoform X2 [Musa acuminata subsp. malaccensis]
MTYLIKLPQHILLPFAGVDLMARMGSNNIQAKLVGASWRYGNWKDKHSAEESTIGAAFFSQVLSLNEGIVKFDIWDTAGQERYRSLVPMYYHGAAAAIIVYDISNMDSYVRAKKWVRELQRQGNPYLILALVGNKIDLEAKRKVESEEGLQYAQENGLFFIETSAKTAENINELFYEIGKLLSHHLNAFLITCQLSSLTAKRLAKARPPQSSGMNLSNETQVRERRLFCCSG